MLPSVPESRKIGNSEKAGSQPTKKGGSKMKTKSETMKVKGVKVALEITEFESIDEAIEIKGEELVLNYLNRGYRKIQQDTKYKEVELVDEIAELAEAWENATDRVGFFKDVNDVKRKLLADKVTDRAEYEANLLKAILG